MIKSFLHRTRVNFFKLLSFFDIKVQITLKKTEVYSPFKKNLFFK